MMSWTQCLVRSDVASGEMTSEMIQYHYDPALIVMVCDHLEISYFF